VIDALTGLCGLFPADTALAELSKSLNPIIRHTAWEAIYPGSGSESNGPVKELEAFVAKPPPVLRFSPQFVPSLLDQINRLTAELDRLESEAQNRAQEVEFARQEESNTRRDLNERQQWNPQAAERVGTSLRQGLRELIELLGPEWAKTG
jgi:hypothetical protein